MNDKKRLEEIRAYRFVDVCSKPSRSLFETFKFLLAQIDKRNEVLRKIVADCNCVGRCPCLTDKAREALGDE